MEQNICLLHNCNACCNPVKIFHFSSLKLPSPPFVELGELLVSEEYETIRLKSYQCLFLDQNGLCSNYPKRPDICKNTHCEAFQTFDKEKQDKIIKKIKEEKFFKIKY